MSAEQLQLLAEILAQQAQVLGMQADNAARQAMRESPAWVGKDFAYFANELESLGQKALKT